MSARPVLYVGNKRFSSWSLRAWLVLKQSGVAFDDVTIPLGTPEFGARIASLSPAGLVPVLHTKDAVIWDSLAIAEWAAELEPDLWPRDPGMRAEARSLVATMHSSFYALRREAPMNLGREGRPKAFSAAVRRDVDLIEALWREHRTHDSPWFFSDWSIVDAFWTPVATRLRSYDITVEPAAEAYVDTLLAEPHYQEWRADALDETYPHALNDDV